MKPIRCKDPKVHAQQEEKEQRRTQYGQLEGVPKRGITLPRASKSIPKTPHTANRDNMRKT
jgi:hypothetical protein